MKPHSKKGNERRMTDDGLFGGDDVGFEHFVVECDGERLSCARAIPAAGRATGVPRSVVFLHGAGNGSKARLANLSRDSAARGYAALSLDFSGHGESSGEIGELSLERRFVQARAVIDASVPTEHELVLVGFSMSGQTVADLTTHYGERVYAIGVCAPAVYAAAAWGLPFAAGFTEVIRTPDSWRQSPALDAFRGLSARAVLATPAVDAIIPAEVTEAVAEALGASRSRLTRLVFEHADHKLVRWFNGNAADRAEFLDAVLAESPEDTAPESRRSTSPAT